jgi:hypothetical protein
MAQQPVSNLPYVWYILCPQINTQVQVSTKNGTLAINVKWLAQGHGGQWLSMKKFYFDWRLSGLTGLSWTRTKSIQTVMFHGFTERFVTLLTLWGFANMAPESLVCGQPLVTNFIPLWGHNSLLRKWSTSGQWLKAIGKWPLLYGCSLGGEMQSLIESSEVRLNGNDLVGTGDWCP